MSCGTPVVAVYVGGVREIVQGPEAGEVIASRSPDAFALAIERVLASPLERAGRRAYAARFDWESIARRYFEILESAARSRRSASVRGAQG
jgi:glycosyltransferase involved in cell wall biosynthesis